LDKNLKGSQEVSTPSSTFRGKVENEARRYSEFLVGTILNLMYMPGKYHIIHKRHYFGARSFMISPYGHIYK
jgi:hypothetical protein